MLQALVRVRPVMFAGLLLSLLANRPADAAPRIRLNAGELDTASPAAQARQFAPLATGSTKQLFLVQWDGPVQPAWVEALTKTRVQIIDYIPDNTYLVYGDPSALNAVRQLATRNARLTWNGALLAREKIHPDAATAGKPRRTLDHDGHYTLQLVLDPAQNADTLALVEALATAPIQRQRTFRHYVNLVAQLPADALEGLAAQPDVISITPYVEPKKRDERQGMIVAGELSGNGPSGPGYLAWLASKGFTQSQFDASGLVVDVTDSGLDNGTTNINHFALYRGGTTSGISRVRYVRLEGTANSGSSIQGCDGHGNLNTHIIGGHVTTQSTGVAHVDSAGYRYGLGIAPFVKVGASVIFDPNNFTSPDYSDLAARAYRDGARISGNSWGADTFGGYDADAQEYDALVRDAQPAGSAVATAGNQQMTFVFAAGNAGSGAQTVGSPGTAKNVITVGAAENVHSHATTNGGNNASGNDGCTTPDSEANSANDIATFSSRGPTSDSRKKPEIVAPGTHVTGGVGQNVKTMAGIGTAIACFDGTGVCALPGGGTVGSTNNFFPLGQRWYSTSSGTSHSTPAVAGGAALVYQWFINTYASTPSPAMVKAFLMNAARYMTGTAANDTLWSNSQGMGMMNLGTAFDGTPRLVRDQVPTDVFTASGQLRSHTVTIVSNSKPFRVTLSWTDAPGSTVGASYNNDLNLTVSINGNLYRGNVFSGAFSTTGGSADFRNNTESVFLPAGTTGIASIVVSAANIVSDGIPNVAPSLDQDYALVVYNAEELIAPVIVPAGSSLAAESCGLGNGAIDPAEAVTVNLALQNVGSAPTTNVTATLLAATGVTAPSGPVAYGALGVGGAPVTNAFSFTATGACGSVLSATLQLQDGATDLGTATYTFTLGGTSAMISTNTLTSTITIPAVGNASPYPSTQTVSGLSGNIEKVTVTLLGFSHTYPDDLDILLVSPGGQTVALMSGAGGGTDAVGVTLTFDDDAASFLGDETAITTGSYKPSLYFDPAFDAPAPAGPYGTTLADLNGASPNGTWRLFIVDAGDGDAGSLTGWRLAITAGQPLCCASNQPPVFNALANQSVTTSNTLTFAVTATDPADGDPITLTASNLPSGATFGVTNGNGTFTWISAEPAGVYTSSFYATDTDGTTPASVIITVTDPLVVDTNCTLIISEYVEGSSNNKSIELYNGTGNPITLQTDQYILQQYNNGSATPSFTLGLTGTVAAGATFVIANASASTGVTARANVTTANSVMNFNGDDAIVLRIGGSAGTVVDSIGQAGVDPGTEWGSGLTSTADNTLRRKATIGRGRTTHTAAFTPADEWDGFAVDTFTGLGSHTNNCFGGSGGSQTPPVLNAIGPKLVTVSNTLTFAVTATETDGDPVTLTASNLPAGATFGATNTAGTFTWTSAAPVGIYTSRFFAADNDGATSETVVITVNAASSGSGGTETFSNLNAPATSYGTGSYVGDNGITWTYRGARKPDATYFIDGQSIGFGNTVSGTRDVVSEGIPGGIGSLSIKYLKYFTGAGSRTFEVYVNDTLVGDIPDANNTTPIELTLLNLNISGVVTVRVVSTGASQIALDTLSWTGYAASNPDTDGDGLFDTWEIDNFGSLTNANDATDSDGDFVSDLEEFIAGTQPTNSASFLQVVEGSTAGTGGVVIQWPGVSGKFYTLGRTTNLVEAIYSIVASNIPGVEPLNVHTDTAPVDAGATYRIEVEP